MTSYVVLFLFLVLVGSVAYDDNRTVGSLPLSWQRNPDNPLSLPQYSGVSVVHPDVMYFPSGKDGYKFWMVYTPSADLQPDYAENPCVVRSNDGVSWTDSGINNPVVPRGSGPWNQDHPADPDWLYVSEYDKWFLVWGVCPRVGEINMAFTYSLDGKNWNLSVNWGFDSPVLIQEACEATMIFRNGKFHLLYCVPFGYGWQITEVRYVTFEWDNNNNKVVGMRQHDSWLAPPTVEYPNGTGHINLVQAGTTFYLIAPRKISETTSLYCWKANSLSLGAFENYGTLLRSDSGWDAWYIYRSSLLQDGEGNLISVDGKYWLYYSGYAHSRPMIHIGFATAPAG